VTVSPGVDFADALADFGDAIALIAADGTTISYAALAAAADRAILPARRCLIALPITTTIDSIVLYLAALRRRYPVILLDAIDSAVGTSVRETYAPWLPDDDCDVPAAASAALHPDLAVMLSTSGSTGSPKLVRLSGRNIASNAASIAEYLGITPHDRAITSLPLHYSYGLSVLNSHLAAGAAIVLTDAPVNSGTFWAIFEAHGVTSIAGVPYSYELFDRIGLRDRALPTLKTMTQAGGRMPPERVAAYAQWAAARGIRLFIMYGQTEATARMAYLPPDLALDHADCVGVAIPGGSFTLQPVAEADTPGVGELVYRGPNVMMGYAEARADLGKPAELDALETGDLAECTDGGLYRIVGRRSRFSKLFGLRLSHDEIERWLAGQGVAAVVTGDDRRLIILTTDPAADAMAVALAEHLGLPRANFVWLAGEAPRLPSGKPDFGAIRKRADAEQPGAEPARSDGGGRDAIGAIFASVFPRATLADTDSFSSLGGDSLSYVTFSMALEEVLGKVPDGWEAMTLAQLRSAGETAVAGGLWRWIETDIVVRAAAICGIVTLHSGPVDAAGDRLGVAGGAAVLMTLFGYNLSRFQRDRLISPERSEVLTRFLARIILPYYLILVGYLAIKRNFDIPSLLLVSNYQGRFGSIIEPFWFLEATTQCLLFMVALFALPQVRQFARDNRMGFAFALLAGAVALKFAGAMVLDQALLQQRTFDATLVYVAIGWMAWTVSDWKSRLACYLVALGITIAYWGASDSHLVWMAVCLGPVLFLPKLPLPRLLAAPVVTIALASFYIYLSHVFVIWMMRSKFAGISALPVFAVSLLIGVLFWWAVQQIPAWPRRHRGMKSNQ
jgi:acyl carrier protein